MVSGLKLITVGAIAAACPSEEFGAHATAMFGKKLVHTTGGSPQEISGLKARLVSLEGKIAHEKQMAMHLKKDKYKAMLHMKRMQMHEKQWHIVRNQLTILVKLKIQELRKRAQNMPVTDVRQQQQRPVGPTTQNLGGSAKLKKWFKR